MEYDYIVGKVTYASAFCSDDKYTATPGVTWKASSRGVCLVKEITAVVRTPTGDILATPYTSSGTSYSQFMVGISPSGFAVTRVVTGYSLYSAEEDGPPADYVEPTEQQK